MSCGTSFTESARQTGVHVGLILEARRSTRPATDQVRTGHQPQNRQGARPHRAARAARAARACRQGDRTTPRVVKRVLSRTTKASPTCSSS
jgi:hypothetical protein